MRNMLLAIFLVAATATVAAAQDDTYAHDNQFHPDYSASQRGQAPTREDRAAINAVDQANHAETHPTGQSSSPPPQSVYNGSRAAK